MKTEIKVSIFLVICFLLSCESRTSIERNIGNAIKGCEKNDCVIRLTDFTQFSWDTAYFFETPPDLTTINQLIGSKYDNHYKEFTRPYIFMLNGKITHFENNPSSIESLTKNQLVFEDVSDTNLYKVFTPSKAVFLGTVIERNNIRFYELKVLKNDADGKN